MLKGWDVEDDADDEVGTTVQSQIRVTATLNTEGPLVWAQYLQFSPHISQCSEGGGQEIDGQCNTYGLSLLDFQILARPTHSEQGLQLLCDWGRRIKLFFVFTGDTQTSTLGQWKRS